MAKPAVLNVTDLIDGLPIGRFLVGVALWCALVAGLDGYDAQVIGYAAPAMIKAWHVPPQSFGPAFASGQFGFLIGTFVMGTLADYVGRKAVILFCTALFGLLTLATVTVHGTDVLTLLRLLTGIAVGGAIPNVIALTAEYSPERRRSTVVMSMVMGIPVGSVLGGLVSASLIRGYGWQSVFYVGGIAPLVLLPLLWWRLPESIRFLAARESRRHAVAALLRRLDPGSAIPADASFAVREDKGKGITLRHLFLGGRAWMTLFVWVVYFMNSLDLFFLASWMPTLIHEAGLTVERAVIVTTLLQVGGIVGVITVGRLVDRLQSCAILGLLYLGGAVFVALLGRSAAAPDGIMVVAFFAGLGVTGTFMMFNGVASGLYPTFIRSTGVGTAYSVGRIGAVIGPLIGGMMLAMHVPLSSMFLVGAIPAVIAAAAVFALVPITRGMIGRDAADPTRLQDSPAVR